MNMEKTLDIGIFEKNIITSIRKGAVAKATRTILLRLGLDLADKIENQLDEGNECYTHIMEYELAYTEGDYKDKIRIILDFENESGTYLAIHIEASSEEVSGEKFAEAVANAVNKGKGVYMEDEYKTRLESETNIKVTKVIIEDELYFNQG